MWKKRLVQVVIFSFLLTFAYWSYFFQFSGADSEVRQETIVIQSSSDIVDATVRSGMPNLTENLGFLGVGRIQAPAQIMRSYVKFNLDALPAAATVSSAILSLYVYDDNTVIGSSSNSSQAEVYQVTNNWSDTSITWNNQPNSTSTGVSQTLSQEGVWVDFNLTSQVNLWLQDSNQNYGVMIRNQDETMIPSVWLINSANFGNNQPKLTINYPYIIPDITPPSISNTTISNLLSNSANISWQTNESATSQISYGLSPSQLESQTSLDSNLVVSHNQSLANLSPNSTYYFQIRSQDRAGNLGLSSIFNFTTNQDSGGGNENNNTEANDSKSTPTNDSIGNQSINNSPVNDPAAITNQTTDNNSSSENQTLIGNQFSSSNNEPPSSSDLPTSSINQPTNTPLSQGLNKTSLYSAGLGAVATGIVASSLLGNITSLNLLIDKLMIFFHRLLVWLLSLFNLQRFKKKNHQGTILSSDDEQPIANALITIIDPITSQIIWQTYSDRKGRFQFNLEKGKAFFMTIKALGFRSIEGRIKDTAQLVVHLKPTVLDLREAEAQIRWQTKLNLIITSLHKPLLALGTVFWFASLYEQINTLNILLGCFYLLSWILEIILDIQPVITGKVIGKNNLDQKTLIIVSDLRSQQIITRTLADSQGQFKVHVPEGQYNLTILNSPLIDKTFSNLAVHQPIFDLGKISL